MLFQYYKGFSRAAAHTLHTAVILAGRQGCSAADTGHLLLAMLQTAQGPAADFLRRKRITESALRGCVQARSCGTPRPFGKSARITSCRRSRSSKFSMSGEPG